MHKDFHLYGTYLAARLAGKNVDEAQKIAYAAQAVDDFTYGGYASCQNLDDILTEDIDVLKCYWSIFHFLPDGSNMDSQDTAERKYIACPHGYFYGLIETAVRNGASRGDEDHLALAGAAMHIIADTYAHKGFSGIPSSLNIVEDLQMCGKQDLGIIDSNNRHVPVICAKMFQKCSIGHGTAGNAPDISWVDLKYCQSGRTVKRDNAEVFADAFADMYKILCNADDRSSTAKVIRERVCRFLKTWRTVHDLDEESTYYEKNDRTFESILRMGLFDDFAVGLGIDGQNEAEALDGYDEYLDEINYLAQEYDKAPKSEKTECFRRLAANSFFYATVELREMIMKEIDGGFAVKNNS